jgi:MoxR-like ATPase
MHAVSGLARQARRRAPLIPACAMTLTTGASAEPYYAPQANEMALFEAAYAARLPVMVKGPTGCGKSRFVEYMAFKLGRPLVTVACNEDMTAADLVGRFLLEPTAHAGRTAR